MKALTFGFTGTEALEMIKNYYPNTWEKKIVETIIGIRVISEGQKIPIQVAFSQIVSKTTDMAVIIELIAAQYFLQLDKKLKQVEDLKAKQLQIGNQLIALESNGYISIDDKKTLRSYYLNLQNEYQIQISKIIDTEISQDEKR
jgi:hypothetical protein